MIKYSETYSPIVEYWDYIKKKNIIVCSKIRKVYKKLAFDIQDKKSQWEYDPKKANHAIEFIENYCKHSKGKLGGQPFILELWEKALIAALFGFVHKIDGI